MLCYTTTTICVFYSALHLSVLRWRELCGMREARKNHGLAVVNNRIYAVGGQGAIGTKNRYYYNHYNDLNSAVITQLKIVAVLLYNTVFVCLLSRWTGLSGVLRYCQQ